MAGVFALRGIYGNLCFRFIVRNVIMRPEYSRAINVCSVETTGKELCTKIGSLKKKES